MLAGGSEAPIIPVSLGGFVACMCAGASCLSAGATSVLWMTVRAYVMASLDRSGLNTTQYRPRCPRREASMG